MQTTISGTYLETLNGANDISADPPIKSPMIPFHLSATRNAFDEDGRRRERQKQQSENYKSFKQLVH